MAEIVNLRRVKKARARAEAEAKAAAKRASHGRTPTERDGAAADAKRRDRELDGAKLERDGEPGE